MRPAAVFPVPPTRRARSARRMRAQQHLVAAQCFADDAEAVEQGGSAGAGLDALRRSENLVAASVLSAAAFLDHSVIELFHELQAGGLRHARRHSRRQHTLSSREWRARERGSTLEKYQLLLGLWDADLFHCRRSPCLEVDRLMRWRDRLESRSAGMRQRLDNDSPARMHPEVTLPSVAAPAAEAQVGRVHLDARSARWAVETAIAFSIEFCRRMGLPVPEGTTQRGAV